MKRKIDRQLGVSGSRQYRVLHNGYAGTLAPAPSLLQLLLLALPAFGLKAEVNWYRVKNLRHFLRGFWRVAMTRLLGLPCQYGQLSAKVIRGNGEVLDFGIISLRVITTAGANYLVDALQNLTEPENFKYHGFGTGTNAEATGDTALQTELTTEYATDNTRPTGSQTEGASANIYRSVGTLSPDGSGNLAITEHGVLSQAATGGGTLLDRSVFSAVNLTRGSDSLQVTYDFTLVPGS